MNIPIPSTPFRRAMLGGMIALSITLGTDSARASGHDWVNLDSDIYGITIFTDPGLVNPWGLVPGPAGNIWVSDNGTGISTRYDDQTGAFLNSDADGSPNPAIIILSSSGNLTVNGSNAISAPTGIVLNHAAVTATGTAQGFLDPKTGTPAWFFYPSEDGAVSAYSPTLTGSNAKTYKLDFTGTAAVVIDHSTVTSGTLTGAVYTGAALAVSGTLPYTAANPEPRYLYVVNFSAGNIEVYDKNYVKVNTFTDTNLPTPTATGSNTVIPDGAYYAPYNIKRFAFAVAKPKPHIERYLVVTFVAVNPATGEVAPGAGLGFVDVFNTDGTLKERLIDAGGDLNAPLGLAYARNSFGSVLDRTTEKEAPIKDALLVGNYGDGLIHAYDILLGTEVGGPGAALQDPIGQDLRFEGLRGMHFGRHGVTAAQLAGDEDEFIDDGHNVFFTAELGNNGRHGLMGRITPH